MVQPLVSIIIPTYNHAHYLGDCLSSVLNQSFSNFEVIIVNNYSTDNTVEVVESFHDNRLRLINFNNNGIIAAARNKGIAVAQGEMIAFLDSDDKWYSNKLERCLKEFTEDIDIVRHSLLIRRSGAIWKQTRVKPSQNLDYDQLLYNGNCLATSAVILRKRCLDEVGGFCEDTRLMTVEDYDLWLRLAKNKYRFSLIDDALGEYLWDENSASKNIQRHLDAELFLLEKHFCSAPANSPLSSKAKERRTAFAYYSAARGCQHAVKYNEALRLYGASIIKYPFRIHPYVGICQSIIGKLCRR